MSIAERVRDFLLGAPEVLAPEGENRFTFDAYAAWVQASFAGGYRPPVVHQTLAGGEAIEPADPDFEARAQSMFAANPVVFSCMQVRLQVFSSVRFQWQQLNNGRPSKMFGSKALALLETPWVGGTTQDLLARMIQDADLAGACYQFTDTPLVRLGGDGGQELVRMRPDWVEVVMAPRVFRGGMVGWRKVGYVYTEGGPYCGGDEVIFPPEDVSVFSPIPDPLAPFRGMSWLTPLIREVLADQQTTAHKQKFFENGATPNMVIRHPPEASAERVKAFNEIMKAGHDGVDNAYRTLHIGGGADVTVVGADFKQIAFTDVQGKSETRIAAAAGTPPVIVGLSEGLSGSSLNAGNYAAARRRMADGTMHPLWGNAAGSLATITGPPPGASTRLWYQARDVPFLREDATDNAHIAFTRAQTMRQWLDGGFTADSVVAAINADADEQLLKHSGLFSVQLQKPVTEQPAAAPAAGDTPAADAPPAAGKDA